MKHRKKWNISIHSPLFPYIWIFSIRPRKIDFFENYKTISILCKKKWKNLASQLINEYYDPLYNYKKKQKKNKVLEQYKLENLKRNSIAKFCFYLHKKYF